MLRDDNSGGTTDIALPSSPLKVPIENGVKQGDTISSKLFTTCLEIVIKDIDCTGSENISVEQETLRLHFQITLYLPLKTDQLEIMLTKMDTQSLAVDHKMSHIQTNYMLSDNVAQRRIEVESNEIEKVRLLRQHSDYALKN
ncbi:uncharacterized protein LOC106870673 [Octopus bimaculoides]|uniref:uncharacterized protein LOC106870673 n=1 Tax=Octopus bimaculoides TaxID=37653 RepID=UPI00071E476C|nr:uncharacterized protein LOC106870673 [Octopus bimaculoides]|eukprot:XP_014772308.1 PREDICTED: uncharacterized protein LOC106870673 [Octopus bimaculoides]